jgi:hypothetical protein
LREDINMDVRNVGCEDVTWIEWPRIQYDDDDADDDEHLRGCD